MVNRIRVGLYSTKVSLTEVGRKWITENYPKNEIWEYDEKKTWALKSISVDSVELTYLSVHYKLPSYVEREITFKMMRDK